MSTTPPQGLNLALQGGGSHGAFTWGVLDALLEDGGFCFPGISGTSAGAMNAVAVAQGFATAALQHPEDDAARHAAGCSAARNALRKLWEGVGAMGSFTLGVPVASNPLMGMMSQFLSPYQTNPLDINPLRRLLELTVDFAQLRTALPHPGMPRLFVCATNVRTGKGEIFSGERLSADAIMASACLPQLYQAVEIEGQYYWDGGFSGNPALYPLIYRTDCRDMLLVQINPIEHHELPETAGDIMERMNEVMFNAGLLSELRAIDFVRRLLAEGRLDATRYKSVLMHRIDGGAALSHFGAASKSRVDMGFLLKLFALGRAQGQQWVHDHRQDVGVRETLQIVDNP
ncbi:patatin-like phospholipase family protein [Comamonas aquatica]|uniref:patatin-like phospholipase family protein n=1 Tax=Comamonas aquatica TaxID=225991 RepID=UPI0021B14235|nr:patatin-like phospholipase family protein [Comamonas aquatica]